MSTRSRVVRLQQAFRTHTAAFIAGGILAVSVLTGGVAFAYWTSSATVTGKVTSPSVAVTQTNFESLSATFINTTTSLTKVGSFTLKNTSSVDAKLSATISAPSALSAQLPTKVWRVADPTSCSANSVPASGVTSGTWKLTNIPQTTDDIAPQGAVSYCVLTAVSDRQSLQSAGGSLTDSQVRLTAKADIGGWAATTTATNTQSTAEIYPLSGDYYDPNRSTWYEFRTVGYALCVDVHSSGTQSGAAVISWSCSTSPNQTWQPVPVNGSADTVTLRPRHNPSARISANADSTVVMRPANSADPAQTWLMQKTTQTGPNGGQVYQFVNSATGKCFSFGTATNDGNARTVVDCTQPQTKGEILRTLVGTPKAPNSDSGTTLSFSLGAADSTPTARLQYLAQNGQWATVQASSSGNGMVSFDVFGASASGSSPGFERGSYSARLIATDGSVLHDGIVFRRWQTGWIFTTNYVEIASGVR